MKKHIKSYFASCPLGFESFLEHEILEISNDKAKVEQKRGGILFECYNEDALEFLLTSRVASKVYKLFYSFDLMKEQDLYTEALKISWEKLFSVEQSFSIKSLFLGRKHLFKSSLYSSQLLKDAIADHFRKIYNKRPSISKDEDVSVLLVIDSLENHFQGSIYLAMSASLGQRHYRKTSYEFSLKENIAAGLLNFFDSKSENFFDPFCGSGTLIFEEILRRYKIAPTYYSLLNNLAFPFEKLIFFQRDPYLKKNFEKIKEKLLHHLHKVQQNFQPNFFASDIVDVFEKNLDLFPLSPIHFSLSSYEKIYLKGDTICNIPYTDLTLPKKILSFFEQSTYQKAFICSLEQYEQIKKLDHFSFFFKNGPKDCVLFILKKNEV